MSNYSNTLKHARQACLQEILQLFLDCQCQEYPFVNKIATEIPELYKLDAQCSLCVIDTPTGKQLVLKSDRTRRNVYEDPDAPGITVMSYHEKSLDFLTLEDLYVLHQHLEKWLPLYQIKRDIYQDMKQRRMSENQDYKYMKLKSNAFYMDEKGYSFKLSKVKVSDDDDLPQTFLLTIYTPVFGYRDLDLWQMDDEKLLKALSYHVHKNLADRSISSIDIEDGMKEWREIGRSLSYQE